MSDRIFLDTNVLVYAFDDSDPAKKNRSLEILEQVGKQLQAVVSTQVLQEFYVVVLRKLKKPLSEDEAEGAVRRFAQLPVVLIDKAMILSAVRTSRIHQLSLWDALIVQSATESGCRRLLTEDLQHGQRFGSLQIENPFLS
ncbi:MAG: PIN domain-containing protein [Deltaproteobacteria bacterium]|nr:PIN domain-containing protein [Deltaproteobacteria bacterium]